MLLTALVQTKGGTLVVNLPRDRIDLEIKIRSVGIQKTFNQIHIIDDEDCDVSVKLFGESDIGRHDKYDSDNRIGSCFAQVAITTS